jgi:2-amino-4-hydroxy-6-hydroxymethyldihydropteridine diphosphokinase
MEQEKTYSQAIIACGSNLDDPSAQLDRASQQLAGLSNTRVLRTATYCQTAPQGITDQPDFLNSAFLIDTKLDPQALLRCLLDIERSQGRVREIKNGPRTLDLDLIFFSDQVLEEEELTVPHPRAHEREFVLTPIAEIAPDWMHPILKKTVSQLLVELEVPSR